MLPLTATELGGTEYEARWTELSASAPRVKVYARRAGHRPPMFLLVPQM